MKLAKAMRVVGSGKFAMQMFQPCSISEESRCVPSISFVAVQLDIYVFSPMK